MPFEDLAAFIRPGFDLPVLGHSYYVPPPNARDGQWLQALIDGVESVVLTSSVGKANKVVLSDEKERTAYEIALGAAYGEMVENGVPWPVLKHAGWTAWMYWTRGETAAERYWSKFGAGQGKAETAEIPSETTSPPPAGSDTEMSTPTPA